MIKHRRWAVVMRTLHAAFTFVAALVPDQRVNRI